MTEALQKFSFYGGLLGVLEGACIGWRSITEIIRCRSSFATARKRKQAFFLLALNRKSLASLEILDFCMGHLSRAGLSCASYYRNGQK